METLKLVSEQKSNVTHLNKKPQPAEYTQLDEAELMKLFPLPRYFQIHFQHVHENMDELQAEMAALRHTLLQLNEKVEILLQSVIEQQR